MTTSRNAIAVLVVTSGQRLRTRVPRLTGRKGSVVAVASWERAASYLAMDPTVVVTDAVTVRHQREQAEHALRHSTARIAVVGGKAPLPHWLQAIDAVALDSRELQGFLGESCVA